jgi:hypothetical protein
LDAFISVRPHMADVGNDAQDIQECDRTRVECKRAAVLVELHYAHYANVFHVDEGCELGEHTQLYFEAVQDAVHALLCGKIGCDEMIERFEWTRRGMVARMAKDENAELLYKKLARIAHRARWGDLQWFGMAFARDLASEVASRHLSRENPKG